ncbi:hypothetical protein CCR75_009028 [Bremia lactucae]|uniref:DNA repair protein XRCC4 n=1 Tax=Bremia lactucae TaxID=4779 RepID=A0A976FJ27_BRELC|nr:hypothetical protein CCR75_009028 [Bremia lactucae]
MSLVEIAAIGVDGPTPSPLSLFVLCSRIATASSSVTKLHVQLLDPPILYETEVTSEQKPRALDCSGDNYVETVGLALRPQSDVPSRFELRWSKKLRTLTLMERGAFSMKFCTVSFEISESNDNWRLLLHQVTTEQEHLRQLLDAKQTRMIKLENVLKQKEQLLELALTAKQSVEDDLVKGFCAVLNAKKDEIRRLQTEAPRLEVASSRLKQPIPKKARKAMGAKLKRKEKAVSRIESDEEMATDVDEEDTKRAKQEAINAYNHVATDSKPTSVQISSADDLLSSMDEIIKNEHEANETTQQGAPGPVAATLLATTPCSAKKNERVRVKKHEPERTLSTVSALQLGDEPMDSEEEDLLNMLS